jgi:Crp-like helix-turn-helix domain
VKIDVFSDRFITHMLVRNIRIEEDLVDQLFNSSEKRLARALLLLARYGKPEETHRVLPRISQETLAEMIGTTRSRVNLFMNRRPQGQSLSTDRDRSRVVFNAGCSEPCLRTSTRSGYDDAARRSRTQSGRYGRQGTRKRLRATSGIQRGRLSVAG